MFLPDYWLVLKLYPEDGRLPFYRLFSTWVGSFTTDDAWRINSGIISVRRDPLISDLIFTGQSGNEYCVRDSERCYTSSSYTQGILDKFLAEKEVEIVPYQDFTLMEWNLK